ncbi:MAG: AEC family transporter [Lachnospiraceae bacterium]|nr:AEC family transporter [Lachnospiraceae bacterium]
MELSVLLFKQMLSLMLMIFMGVILVKAKIVKKEDSRVLAALTLYVINPCMVLRSLKVEYTKERISGLILAVTVAVLAHLFYILVTYLLSKVFRIHTIERMSMIYSNGGNLIVPLVLAILGEEQVFYCCAFIMVQTAFFWVHLVCAVGGKGEASIRKIVFNPNIIAIVVGIVLFVSGFSLPDMLESTIYNMGGIIGPVCMLMLGMIMADVDLKHTFLSVRNWIVCLMRLVVLPFCVILLIRMSSVTVRISFAKDVLLIVFLAISAPVAVTVTQMADLFHNNEKQAGAINVMSVLLSVITMPFMLAVYQGIV